MIVFQVMGIDTSYSFFYRVVHGSTLLGKSHQLYIKLLSLNTTIRRSLSMGNIIHLFTQIHPLHILRQKKDLIPLFNNLLRSYQSITLNKETTSSTHASILPLQWQKIWLPTQLRFGTMFTRNVYPITLLENKAPLAFDTNKEREIEISLRTTKGLIRHCPN